MEESDGEIELDAVIAENSPELAQLVEMTTLSANNAGTGFGSNGKFLAPIDTPDPNAIKIYTAEDLDNVRNNLSGSYVLMNDIGLSDINGGEWVPIGSNDIDSYLRPYVFRGIFDGQGHVIKSMQIPLPGYRVY